MRKISLVFFIVLSVLFVGITPNHHYHAATGSKLAEIKQKGKIVMGTSPDYPPFEFPVIVDGKTTIEGFDVEVGRAIAKQIGVDLEVKAMDFNGLLPALQAGTIDMVISGMSGTPERAKSVDFSVPYFTSRNVMMILIEDEGKFTSKADFAGTTVGAQKGSIQEDDANTVEGAQVRAIADLLDLVQDLKQKNVKGVVIEEDIAKSIIETQNDLMYIPIAEWETNNNGNSVAIAKGSEDLLEEIDIAINGIFESGISDQLYADAKALAEGDVEVTFFEKYGSMIAKGAAMTLALAFLSVIFGSILGLLIALAKTSNIKILQWMSSIYVEVVRGTPMLIQIYIVYYALPYIGIKLPPFVAGVLAVSLNSGAYVAEIIRAGINAVDNGQTEAGKSLGMGYSKIMQKIVIPQAIKNILPALGNEFVTIIKESSIVSIIGVTELMYAADTIRGNTYQPFKPLIIAAIIYFVMTFTLSNVIKIIEGKMNKNAKN